MGPAVFRLSRPADETRTGPRVQGESSPLFLRSGVPKKWTLIFNQYSAKM